MNDEDLLEIVISNRNKYDLKDIVIITEILENRGYQEILKEQAYKRFSTLSDQLLINIIEHRSDTYPDLENQIIENIIKERGYQIDSEEIELDETGEIVEKSISLSYFPVVLGIILLFFNFYMSDEIYNYQITGIENATSRYLKQVGIFHDIIIRLIIVGIIYHFLNHRRSSSKYLWYILGLIFGAWTLTVFGIYIIVINTSDDENNDDIE